MLLRKISNILDYDFLQHFEPEVTRRRQEPAPYDISDTEVLFNRDVVGLQSRVKILEQRWETFKSTAEAE
jgi:hypothetical protein